MGNYAGCSCRHKNEKDICCGLQHLQSRRPRKVIIVQGKMRSGIFVTGVLEGEGGRGRRRMTALFGTSEKRFTYLILMTDLQRQTFLFTFYWWENVKRWNNLQSLYQSVSLRDLLEQSIPSACLLAPTPYTNIFIRS